MTLEKFVCQKRREKKIKQKEIAELFNLTSAQFISNYERGLCRIPDVWLPKLSKKIKVPIAQMVNMRMNDERQRLVKVLGVK